MFHVIDLMEREARTYGEIRVRTSVFRDWTAQLRAEWQRLTAENEALKVQVADTPKKGRVA